MSWQSDAEEAFAGEFVKFKDGIKRKIQFLTPPNFREFETKDHKKKPSYDFEVIADDEAKTLSVTSKRLMDLIIAENKDAAASGVEETDEDWYLGGKTYFITAMGEGFDRQWRLKEIPTLASVPKPKPKTAEKPLASKKGVKFVPDETPEPEKPEEETQEEEGEEAQEVDPYSATKELIKAHLEILRSKNKNVIPFKVAEAVKAKSLGQVKRILADLDYLETSETSKKGAFPIWKHRSELTGKDLLTREAAMAAAEKEEQAGA